MKAYSTLEQIFEKINIINNISSILGWDSSTVMPRGGHESRSQQLCYLSATSHELISSPEVFDLIQEAKTYSSLNEWQIANLKLMEREYKHAVCVEKSLIEEFSNATSECEMVWREARKNSSYKTMLPSFKKVIALSKEIATVKAESFGCSKYDALLDQYDPQRKSSELDAIFLDLGAFLKKKIPEIINFQDSNISEFSKKYDISKQKELGIFCMEKFGFDFNHGRLDTSIHPFCGGIPTDVRITTRYDENNFLSSLFGVIHESGHGMYEQNLPKSWMSQPVGKALGMSIHESQSLLAEMQIGTSKAFISWLEQIIMQKFGEGYEHKKENIYKFINKVKPSFIRVEADEVTYPCHVILRYDLEKKIINGELSAEDIPDAWNQHMKEFLGIVPTDDANGCMQDIHWPSGYFGYFPCYSLGAMIACQFFTKIKKDLPDTERNIGKGDLSGIFGWLKENIHSKGSLLSVDELLKLATGKNIDVECYKQYITDKYLFNKS